MNHGIAFLLGGLLLFVWMGILWAFKELCFLKLRKECNLLELSVG